MSKDTKKKKLRKKARKTGRAIEANAVELSRKIWLAGIGAYGMAYDVARSGANVVNDQSAEMFDDLVKRGSSLESEVLVSLGGNPAVTAATRQVQKVTSTSQKLQSQVRDRFDARMNRMRDLLGVNREGSTVDKLARKLEKLEDDVASATKGTVSKADSMLKTRLARLSDEIDRYVGDVEPAKAPAKAKKSVKKKTVKAAKPAKAKVVKAPKTAKAPKTVRKAADDLTVINGVGPAMAKQLVAAGFKTFADIAGLKKADAVALDEKIGARGRLLRDEWVKQAKTLAKS